MEFGAAQRDVAVANVGGAPGVLVSGIVWLIAGMVWRDSGVGAGYTTLFFGGMAIFPLSVLIARAVFRAPGGTKGNPLEALGLEGTAFLFAGLLIAFALLRVAPEMVFPVVAIAIGARYFTFRTLYGQPLFVVLAILLVTVGGVALLRTVNWPGNVALVVGGIEIGFAVLLLLRRKG